MIESSTTQDQPIANPPDIRDYGKAGDVARVLNVSPLTLWKWGNEGKIERLRIGSQWRYKWPDSAISRETKK